MIAVESVVSVPPDALTRKYVTRSPAFMPRSLPSVIWVDDWTTSAVSVAPKSQCLGPAIGWSPARTGGFEVLYAIFQSSLRGREGGGIVIHHHATGVLKKGAAEEGRRASVVVVLLVVVADRDVEPVHVEGVAHGETVVHEALLRGASPTSSHRAGETRVDDPVDAHEPLELLGRPLGQRLYIDVIRRGVFLDHLEIAHEARRHDGE